MLHKRFLFDIARMETVGPPPDTGFGKRRQSPFFSKVYMKSNRDIFIHIYFLL